jgi:hypothetical protein
MPDTLPVNPHLPRDETLCKGLLVLLTLTGVALGVGYAVLEL